MIKNKNNGFTLVELSITLVLMGLLVGGTISGLRMYNSAQVVKLIAESEEYISIIDLFREEYGAYPGDLPDATQYWDNTDNGNGDGKIDWQNEGYRAWQHLGESGILEHRFTGTATNNEAIIATNVPQSEHFGNAGFSLIYNPTFDSAYTNKEIQNKNYLSVGAHAENSYTKTGFLTAKQIYLIDKKIDDAIPNKGTIIANNHKGKLPDLEYDLENGDDWGFYLLVD